MITSVILSKSKCTVRSCGEMMGALPGVYSLHTTSEADVPVGALGRSKPVPSSSVSADVR